jgi:hypothetical protein
MTKTLIIAGLAVASLAVAAQEVTLKRTFTEGSTDVYKVDTKTTQTMNTPTMGEVDTDVNSSVTYSVKFDKVDPATGTANVTTTTKFDKLEITGSMAQMMPNVKAPAPIVTTGQIDSQNRLKLDKPAKVDPQLAMLGSSMTMQSLGTLVQLPGKPVKLGDTWDVDIPANPFMKDGQKVTCKLIGEKNVDGVDAWVVGMTGNIKIAADMSEMMKNNPEAAASPAAGMKILVNGTVDLDSQATIEKSSGKTLTVDTKMKSKTNVELPDMGMNMDGGGTTTMTVALQK